MTMHCIAATNTPSCIKIRSFWVLEDKYRLQQKLFQNRLLLLLDVKGGSYAYFQGFTKPMAFYHSVEHSYITYSK